MLPKINRIKRKNDFDAIFKGGKSAKNGPLILKMHKNALGINRFAFVVSQKVSKKATVRNKIRRRMSEIVKANMLAVKNGTDAVFVALPGMEKKDFLETKEIIETLIKKCLVQ